MNRTLRAILIINNGQDVIFKEITFEDTLQDIYQLLDCEIFEAPIRYIQGVPYTLLVDEEGIYTKKGLISAVSYDVSEVLLGNILIVKAYPDSDGNMLSLDDDDIRRITYAYNKKHQLLLYDFR